MIRGDIWWVDFGEPLGSEPRWRRPAIIVQSDDFNKSDMNTTIVIPLTTNLRLAEFPGNVLLSKEESKLSKHSVAVIPQITVIDRIRLLEHMSILPILSMKNISEGIKLILAV
nr:type II toxin-antitoxin system PemK/MazF family toxin [uncultured Treponema sp.]